MERNDETWANMTLQRSARVGQRNIWFYLIRTSIGSFHVVQWEEGPEIHEKIFRNSYDRADRFFENTVAKIVRCKM